MFPNIRCMCTVTKQITTHKLYCTASSVILLRDYLNTHNGYENMFQINVVDNTPIKVLGYVLMKWNLIRPTNAQIEPPLL
jgi:hypothetical protein